MFKPRWISSEYTSFSALRGGKATRNNFCDVHDTKLLGCIGENYSLIATEIPNVYAPLFCPFATDEILKAFSLLHMLHVYRNRHSHHVTIAIIVGFFFMNGNTEWAQCALS